MGVKPWELDEQAPFWRQWIAVVMHEDAVVEHERARQEEKTTKRQTLKERAKQKAREFYGGGKR